MEFGSVVEFGSGADAWLVRAKSRKIMESFERTRGVFVGGEFVAGFLGLEFFMEIFYILTR